MSLIGFMLYSSLHNWEIVVQVHYISESRWSPEGFCDPTFRGLGKRETICIF